jgi:Icc-related predicted phosphoesterase
VSVTLYYASDIHGSDRLWRKFVNAARFYGADVLVMGGDIAGKAVVPIVEENGGFRAREILGDRVFGEDELREAREDRGTVDELFRRAMAESLERWLDVAADRLRGSGIQLYIMLGNDDDPALRDVLAASSAAVDPEDETVDLGEGIQMLSCGHANPTPWNSPRELPEEELERHLEELVAKVDDPVRSVFNLHVPPIRTSLDRAPALDETLKPVVRGGSVAMTAAGSQAVRDVIERYQPLVGLHGHIHESRGVAKVGKTVCINPGSEYAEGVLHGALVVVDSKKGLRNYQLVTG